MGREGKKLLVWSFTGVRGLFNFGLVVFLRSMFNKWKPH